MNAVVMSSNAEGRDSVEKGCFTQEYLRLAADRSNLSDLEIARRAGIAQSTVYRLLNAQSFNPSFSNVQSICRVLRVPLPYDLPASLYAGVQAIGDCTLCDVPEKVLLQAKEYLANDAMKVQGVVGDQSGNKYFPKDTILSYQVVGVGYSFSNDDIIVALFQSEGRQVLLPMEISTSSNQGYYIASQITKSEAAKKVFVFPKGDVEVSNSHLTVTIVGKVCRAVITYL